MKSYNLLLAIFLCSFNACMTEEKTVCQHIQNQYWLDIDTSAIFIAYYGQDTVSVFSSEVGFFHQYKRCENNILYSSFNEELTDASSSQKLSLNQDTLTLEVIKNSFVQKGFISKMKRISREEVDSIINSQIDTTMNVHATEPIFIEPPRN